MDGTTSSKRWITDTTIPHGRTYETSLLHSITSNGTNTIWYWYDTVLIKATTTSRWSTRSIRIRLYSCHWTEELDVGQPVTTQIICGWNTIIYDIVRRQEWQRMVHNKWSISVGYVPYTYYIILSCIVDIRYLFPIIGTRCHPVFDLCGGTSCWWIIDIQRIQLYWI